MTFNVVNSRIGWVLAEKMPKEGPALAIPANDHLWMGAGPGLELKKSLGNDLELEAVRQGPVAAGETVSTPGTGTGFETLFHLAVCGQDLTWVPEAGGKATQALIEQCETKKIREILIHPLHHGVHGDAMVAMKEVLKALMETLEEGRRIDLVQFVMKDQEEWQLHQDMFLQLLLRA